MLFRDPETATVALISMIGQSTAPGMIIDEYAAVLEALPDKLVNRILDAQSARNNELARKHTEAEHAKRDAKQTERPRSRQRSRSDVPPEPDAAPAPGGVQEGGGEIYGLRDELGREIEEFAGVSAAAFVAELQRMLDDATPDNAKRLKIHNRREVARLIQTEGDNTLARASRKPAAVIVIAADLAVAQQVRVGIRRSAQRHRDRQSQGSQEGARASQS